MQRYAPDVAVVGAGTVGCYAGAKLAGEGFDVTVVERKPESEAGHIACGDALKGADNFPDQIPKSKLEPAITNSVVDHGRFEIPSEDAVLDIPVPGELGVIDRMEYGRILLEGAAAEGVEFHYDTVVNDVVQEPGGRVTGLKAINDGSSVEYESRFVIDGTGALSLLQDKIEFDQSHFDTNVRYTQFSSAYREVLEVKEPVEYHDALVFKPTQRAAGYLWYFPRTPTEINVGLGFQMDEDPMKLVQALKEDISQRPEFEGAVVKDKLGASLPTRRPYDSAVGPGFIAAGDSAAHVNPTTGGGIAGAAYAATYAAEQVIEALTHEDFSEGNLWRYNTRVMEHFGARYAALDVYNIFATAYDLSDLMGLLAALPGEQLSEALYSGSTGLGPMLALKTLWKSRGHWSTMFDLYRTKQKADELLSHYNRYPSSPAGFDAWQGTRDRLMDDIYATLGADAKY